MQQLTKFVAPLGLGFLLISAAAWLAPGRAAAAPGAAPVVVTNTSASPVPVQDIGKPVEHPFQIEFCEGGSGYCSTTPYSFTVPSGQRLIVEHTSGTCFTAALSSVKNPSLETTVGGVTVIHRFNTVNLGASSEVSFAQPMRIYGDPGSILAEHVQSIGGDAACKLYISGVLVDVP